MNVVKAYLTLLMIIRKQKINMGTSFYLVGALLIALIYIIDVCQK